MLLTVFYFFVFCFFFKQKTAYEMRISDWSSDVCSSDLNRSARPRQKHSDRSKTVASARLACLLVESWRQRNAASHHMVPSAKGQNQRPSPSGASGKRCCRVRELRPSRRRLPIG